MWTINFLTQTAVSSPTPVEQTAPPDLQFGWLFIKTILILILICVGIFLVAKYFLPKTSLLRKNPNSRIEILERFGLEPKKNLYLLRVDRQTILVGSSEHGLSTLAHVQDTHVTPKLVEESGKGPPE